MAPGRFSLHQIEIVAMGCAGGFACTSQSMTLPPDAERKVGESNTVFPAKGVPCFSCSCNQRGSNGYRHVGRVMRRDIVCLSEPIVGSKGGAFPKRGRSWSTDSATHDFPQGVWRS